jgi:hypothetical protein
LVEGRRWRRRRKRIWSLLWCMCVVCVYGVSIVYVIRVIVAV